MYLGHNVAPDTAAPQAGIADAQARKLIFNIIVQSVARVLRFCKMAAVAEPSMPMSNSDEVQIVSTAGLRKFFAERRTVSPGAVPRVLLRARLRITLYSCVQLPKMDKAGLCDAFVKAVVGKQAAESDVKYRSLNPTWGIALDKGGGTTGQELVVDCCNPTDRIKVELWDFDELKALDIATRTTTVTRSDEIIGVAVPASHASRSADISAHSSGE